MTFLTPVLQKHKQLIVLSLWITFIGWAVWQHALQSQQPPIYDAATYYQKAYKFWTEIHQHKLFNPLNVEPSFRPPGTIFMSYPFGFDIDYHGFYFRSIFLPIVLLNLAIVIGGYRHELDSKSRWHLVLVAIFLSTLPCFYYFEVSPEFPAPSHWGLVDNFFAGVAALAAALVVRSVWSCSLAWLGFGAALSSFCLLIKPTGALIMALVGLTWFGLAMLKLKAVWQLPDERKNTTRWLLLGMTIFAVSYLLVLAGSFTSAYLSSQNLAYGNGAIVIMKTELLLSWSVFQSMIHMGVGYPFVVWLLLTIILVSNYLWITSADSFPWSRHLLIGLAIASGTTFIFGLWFWILGSGGTTQIRYFIPFVLMAAIFVLPSTLTALRTMPSWIMSILSMLMLAPAINMGLILSQQNAPIDWQKWTGVNLTSGVLDPVVVQAQNFVTAIKREDRNVTLYSMSMNVVDADFQSVVDHARIAISPMPTISIHRPVDWQRPTTYRKEEMLDADYWLFQPVHDSRVAQVNLANVSIDDLNQEIVLFQSWATGLTTNEGVVVVSDTPTARVLRVTDPILLESAFDALVAKHHWRNTFVTANPKHRFSEKELLAALVPNPPSLENVNFGERFHLRALSVSRIGGDTTLNVWWKPLSPLQQHDWALFIHSIDDKDKIVFNNYATFNFNRSLSSLDGAFLFDQITFKNPLGNGVHRLAIGILRPNQAPLIADKGTRDWNNQRVIIPLP